MDQIIKKKLARNWFKTLQEVLCKEIEELEGGSNLFKCKNWERGKKSNEGGGQSRIHENGKIFDKVGVNFSEVYGKFSKKFRKNDTLLFGRESAGVTDAIHKKVKNKIKIPMIENKRSLNLATSVAIALSENLRQTNYIWTK